MMKLRKLAFCMSLLLALSNLMCTPYVSAESGIIIIDNKDSAVELNGTWDAQSMAEGFWGDDYAILSDGSARVNVSVESSGYYKLYFRHPKNVDASEKLSVIVKDSQKTEYKTELDQTINGGYWVFAGTYFFTNISNGQIELKSSDGKAIVFDAIMLEQSVQTNEKAKPSWFDTDLEVDTEDTEDTDVAVSGNGNGKRWENLLRITTIKEKVEEEKTEEEDIVKYMTNIGDEIIYDNESAGSLTSGGTWKKETADDAYNKTYMTDGASGFDLKQYAKWKPTITTTGTYELYMRWPKGENRPKDAKLVVKDSNFVVGTALVDQRKNSGEWNLVTTVELYANTPYAVHLRADSAGITAADAIKLKLVSYDAKPSSQQFETKATDYTSEKQDKYNIVYDGTKFEVTKNGEIFQINGADISDTVSYIDEGMEYFAEAGGNLLRTYSWKALEKGFLDYAYEHGVGVAAGISISEDRKIYEDATAYRNYINEHKQMIDKYKNHPALVMWFVNNESEGTDKDGEIYAAIEEVSQYIKATDPYHPIATAFAGCGTEKQTKLMKLAPAVDILGMNAYGSIDSVYPSVATSGWKGPVMITEYGPNGTWGSECSRTSWNVILEQNNDEKANLYRERHLKFIAGNDKSIGGFAFCLPYAIGNEGTLSWYAMVYNGMRTPVLNEMQYAWTGKYPSNKAPRIKSFKLDGLEASDNIILTPGQEVELAVNAVDSNRDLLDYQFEIREEVQGTFTGKASPLVTLIENPENSSKVKIKAPERVGYYRIYACVYDGNNNVGVDNIPIYVQQGNSGTSEQDIEEIEELLMAGSRRFIENKGFKADVEILAEDNINGMLHAGTGSASIEGDDENIHISSEVTYEAGGLQKSEVFIGRSTNYIWNNNQYDEQSSEKFYEIYTAFENILLDKAVMEEFTLDTAADEKYDIMSAPIHVPELSPLALSGENSADFITDEYNPDAYSLKIYISKDSKTIDKVIVTVGYMRSVEKAEYRKLTYTYNIDYSDFDIVLPE